MNYDLTRFVDAHEHDYENALAEIRAGRKESHWMWYIFPQLRSLGRSDTAMFYGIRDLAEARAFLEHPVLGAHLKEISAALLTLDTNDARAVMGYPDDLKLCSCMTLFRAADGTEDIFRKVLEKYYQGRPDLNTLTLLRQER